MKKQILIVAAIIITAITTQVNATNTSIDSLEISDVNAKAVKNLHKEYPSVTNASWYKSGDGGYTASFNMNAIHTTVGFNSKGKILNSVKYYDEKGLPQNIWEQVKSSYYTYNILKVAEINVSNQKIYLIYLLSDKFIKTLKITDEEMQEVENFNRV